MSNSIFRYLAFFSVKFFAMELETQLPTTLKQFTKTCPVNCRLRLCFSLRGVPHARDNSSLNRQIIHFLRTSRMLYYDNAEFVGAAFKKSISKATKQKVHDGFEFCSYCCGSENADSRLRIKKLFSCSSARER